MNNKESMLQLLDMEKFYEILKKEDSHITPWDKTFPGMIYDKSGNPGQISCMWETISEKDRLKPMGLSCPCSRCRPYSLSEGSDSSTNKSLLMNKIS